MATNSQLQELLLKPPFAILKSLCCVIDDLEYTTETTTFTIGELCDLVLSYISQTNLIQPFYHEIINQEVIDTSMRF